MTGAEIIHLLIAVHLGITLGQKRKRQSLATAHASQHPRIDAICHAPGQRLGDSIVESMHAFVARVADASAAAVVHHVHVDILVVVKWVHCICRLHSELVPMCLQVLLKQMLCQKPLAAQGTPETAR